MDSAREPQPSGREPESSGEETIEAGPDEETTLADEEWPVAKHYRVDRPPPSGEVDDAGATTVVQSTTAAPRPGRRFPPDLGPGLLIALIAVLLIPAGIWLASVATDDSEATATDTGPTTTSPGATDTTPTQTTTTPSRVNVPRVVGLSLDEARTVLEGAGFRVRVTRKPSDRASGVVQAQSPDADSQLERNGVVRLTVSGGAEQVEVPRVVGLDVTEATNAIRAARLQPELREIRSQKPAGTVVRQSPAAGIEVDADTVVELVIATAPPAPATVEVPQLVGLTSSAARRQLRELGLRSTVLEVASEQPRGTVVGQTPRPGRQLEKGETVTLRVSSGPADVLVPDVVGFDEQSARLELESAGFEVRVVDVSTTDPSEDGLVISQEPSGESSRPKGSVVTIRVARFS